MSNDRRWYDGTDFPCPSSVRGSPTGENPASTCENLHRSYHLADTSLLVVYPTRGEEKDEKERGEREVNRVAVASSSAVVDERRRRRTTRGWENGEKGGGRRRTRRAKVPRQGRADARADGRASGRRASGVGARRGGWLEEGMTPRTTGVNRCTMLPVSHSHGASSLALISRARRARDALAASGTT